MGTSVEKYLGLTRGLSRASYRDSMFINVLAAVTDSGECPACKSELTWAANSLAWN